MSQEAVLNLFETLEKEPDLRERLTAIEDPAEVARIAELELGLKVTAEELISAVTSIQDEEGLNEEELEAVAGGCRRPWPGRPWWPRPWRRK